MRITVSKENYVKAIAEAEAEGETVIAATLARWLQISPPAVTAAIQRLKRDDLVKVARTGNISLTASGREIAKRVLNRHHLIERMLTEMFGMEWYKVHEEAEQLEHAVSEDFEKKLVQVLGIGKTCPHGNIVGRDTPEDRLRRGWVSLDTVESTQKLKVMSVYERDRKLMEFLDSLGLRPGVGFEWLTRNYDDTLTLLVNKHKIQLGVAAARRIWVEPVR